MVAPVDPNFRYATQSFTTDGTDKQYNIAFEGGYIDQSNVLAYSVAPTDDGLGTDRQAHTVVFISESGTTAQVKVSPVPVAGRKLTIYRDTEKGESLVDYRDNSLLTADNLNLANKQATFNAAEFMDRAADIERVAELAYDAAVAVTDPDLSNLQFLATKDEVAYADSVVAANAHAEVVALDAAVDDIVANPNSHFADNSISGNKLASLDDAKTLVHAGESSRLAGTLHDWINKRAKFTDFIGSDQADVSAALTAAEASSFVDIDLGGGTYQSTTYNGYALTKNYYNGTLLVKNASGNLSRVGTKNSMPTTALLRNHDKCNVVGWSGKRVLWLGTSIPHQGAGTNSYPDLAAADLGAICNNMAWSSSHATYNRFGDAHTLNNMLSLSMTRDDVAAGLAQYGAGSIYDPNFDPISKPDNMTCDYRIYDQMTAFQDAVVLDHAHNDQQNAIGSLYTEQQVVTGITIGTTTQITVSSIGTISVGDAIVLSVPNTNKLNYLSKRVQAVSGNVITVNFNSSTVTGLNVSGAAVFKVDRNTLRGAFNFLRSFILHSSFWKFGAYPALIFASAPSDWSESGNPLDLRSVNYNVRQLAVDLNAAFFDINESFDVNQRLHRTYFQDGTHPTTSVTRRALANHWVQWMQGGAQQQINTSLMLTKTSGVTFADGQSIMYDDVLGSFVPQTYFAATPSGVWGDAFDTNSSANYVLSSGCTWQASTPTGSGAMACAYTPGNTPYFYRDLSFSDYTDTSFQVYIPAGPLHVGAGVALTNVMSINSSDGTPQIGFAVVAASGATTYSMQFTYFNSAGAQVVVPINGTFSSGLHTVRLLMRKKTATVTGGVKIYVDGSLNAIAMLDNQSRSAGSRLVLGVTFSNMDQAKTWYIDFLTHGIGAISNISARYSGIMTVGTKTATVVNGIITTVV